MTSRSGAREAWSLSGSRSGCPSNRRDGRRGRRRGPAGPRDPSFFHTVAPATEEAPHGSDAEAGAGAHVDQPDQLGERDVGLLFDGAGDQLGMGFDPVRTAIAALGSRRRRAGAPPPRHPADRRALADVIALCRLPAGRPRLDRGDHSPPEIFGIRSCPQCWLPPSQHGESQTKSRGSRPKRGSMFGKRSRALWPMTVHETGGSPTPTPRCRYVPVRNQSRGLAHASKHVAHQRTVQ